MERTERSHETNNIPLEPRGATDSAHPRAGPTLFEGATFSSGPRAPGAVTPGMTFNISGSVYFDCISCELGVKRETRVLIEMSNGTKEVALGKMGNGEETDFSATVTAPAASGTTMAIRVASQRNPPGPEGWKTDDSATLRVPVVSQEEKDRQEFYGTVQDWGPFVLGGATAGYGVTRVRGGDPVYGATAGAAAGAGSKWMMDAVEFPDVRIPLGQALAATALLAAGGYFFSTTLGSAADIAESARR